MSPSQPFLVTVLALLAGGDAVVRDAVLGLLALAGIHLAVPSCYVGSGPGC